MLSSEIQNFEIDGTGEGPKHKIYLWVVQKQFVLTIVKKTGNYIVESHSSL